MKKMLYLIKKAWYFAWHRHHLLIPFPVLKNYIKSFFRILKRTGGLTSDIFSSPKTYMKWLKDNPIPELNNKKEQLISIIYPILDNNIELTLESISKVNYKNYELLLIVDVLNNSTVKSIIKKYSHLKIKTIYHNKVKGIAYSINEGIKEAKSDNLLFINSNLLVKKELLSYINDNINYDMVYTDEDHYVKEDLYEKPIFKPDFALDTFLGANYLGNLLFIKKELINRIGMLKNKETFDHLLIRCVLNSKSIKHIPLVLYHDCNKNNDNLVIINEYLKTKKLKAKLIDCHEYPCQIIKYLHHNPLVSIIIPFKNQFQYTKECVENLINNNSYKNIELILIDNNTDDMKMLKWLESIKNKNIKVYHQPIVFNFSKLCNYGASKAHGDYLLFLNNDTKIIDKDFLDWMVGYASQKHVGAVGIKLLYPDRVVQHMGVVLSYGGYAGHFGVTHDEKEVGHLGMCIRPYDFSAVTAACLLIDKRKFNEINGFEEKLAVALNDVDLCLKLLQKGYYNVCLNNVKMFHLESKSRGFDYNRTKSERYQNEQKFIKNKWGNRFDKDDYYSKWYF